MIVGFLVTDLTFTCNIFTISKDKLLYLEVNIF